MSGKRSPRQTTAFLPTRTLFQLFHLQASSLEHLHTLKVEMLILDKNFLPRIFSVALQKTVKFLPLSMSGSLIVTAQIVAENVSLHTLG